MDKPKTVSDEKDKQNKKTGIDSLTLRERMTEVAKKINWIPGFGLERELDWLKNMHDWLISKKNRYWGLALPIWECGKCGNFQVVGSKEELKEKAVSGWDKFDGQTPHKPQIDEIKIKCGKCGQIMDRIEPVGNPWLDAGIVAYSTVSENNQASNFDVTDTKPLYLTDREKWKKWVPVDFITESFPGQFKNWFYSLIAMSTVMENINPFKTVLGFGTMVDGNGNAFHKSAGNAIEFVEAADNASADVIRWMCARQNPSDNLLFSYNLANEVRRSFHLKIWNTYNYFVTYANINGWVPVDKNSLPVSNNVLDKWILTELVEMERVVSASLDNYQAYKATEVMEKFVDDLSNWYIRRSRDRAALNYEDKEDQGNFFETLYFVLKNLTIIMAPINPFMSDMIYTNLTKEESVHLTNWPHFEDLKKDEDLSEKMSVIRSFAEKVHSVRKESSLPVRQPLSEVVIKADPQKYNEILGKLLEAELNVKKVTFSKTAKKEVELDTRITPELKEEAEFRELIRQIQNERKNIGVSMEEYVNVSVDWQPKNKKLLEKLASATLAKSITKGEFKVSKI